MVPTVIAPRHRHLLVVVTFLLAGCAAPAAPPAPPNPVVVRDDLQQVFTAAGVRGTFATLDTADGQLTLVDRDRAERRAVPASTFKIPHAVIALETGVVTDPDHQVLPYGGGPQPFPSWEHDTTLRDAVSESNAAVFGQLALRIGPAREQQWLDRLDYGNGVVDGPVDRFWLDGPLEISPVEQTAFLARLATRRLPADRRSQDLVADILRVPGPPGVILRGKTGWRFDPPPGTPQLGWWVGWVERPGRAPVTFALAMDMTGPISSSNPDAPKRSAVGRELLTRLGVL